ncbi:hypothetical protein LCGC14_1102970 [marine sediment metagenome]|uniref:Uncharacterized protein n=1 Tax=marine sediment metagenome TaxID=412755 RepID=A0A0F9M8Y1_9ZZZZ|nr:hypothetical protein [archaeon]HEC39027.1 hypothetical protein [bacterium]
MAQDGEIEKSNLEIRKDKEEVTRRVKDYLIRAHSFQEVGTEKLPDENYDILHFPHILLGAGVIMAIYGFYIILISTDLASYTAYIDGFIVLVVGNVIAFLGMLRLLKKYWSSYLILLILTIGIIFGMLAMWYFVFVPIGIVEVIPTNFWAQAGIVILSTTTFAFTACFVWYIIARYTSFLYYKVFSGGKAKGNRFFIVDPWRKTLSSKTMLIKDIMGRVIYPFLFLLAIMLTLSEEGELSFFHVTWDNYFQAILPLFFLLCAMVVIFPALWLLDYVRFYDENRLEVRSMGRRILTLIKGYAGFGVLVSFLSRSQNEPLIKVLLDLYMLFLYLIPSLIILIGGYVLLTERDVYYIASKVTHGDVVIVDYKLMDSKGKELEWWAGSKKKIKRGKS